MSYNFYDFNLYGSNKLKSKPNFKQRKLYQEVYPAYTSLPESFSFWEGSNVYYGRIDLNYNVVNVDENTLLSIKTDNKSEVFAINFVAEAFSDFREYVKFNAASKLSPDAFLVKNWDAVKGYSSPHSFYQDRMKDLYDVFVKTYIVKGNRHSKILNFDDFMDVFLNEFIPQLGKDIPLTKSGMIISNFYNPTATGLCIEISNDSHSDDNNKLKKYIKSSNFEFYLLSAAKFGFLVDKNAPWRLVANINSAPMQKYMEKYSVDKQNLFYYSFYKTSLYDIDNMKVYLRQFYNTYTSAYPIGLKERPSGGSCSETKSRYIVVKREKMQQEQLDKQFSDLFWLQAYYLLKIRELNAFNNLSSALVSFEIKKIKEMYNQLDFVATFDYVDKTLRRYLVENVVSLGIKKQPVITKPASY